MAFVLHHPVPLFSPQLEQPGISRSQQSSLFGGNSIGNIWQPEGKESPWKLSRAGKLAIPRHPKSWPAQIATPFARVQVVRPEAQQATAEAKLPLKLPKFVTVESLGSAYRGCHADLYWRPKVDEATPRHPYPVGYQASKRFKGDRFVQTVREGEAGPEFTVCRDGKDEFVGNSPEEVWGAAGVAAGMSLKYARASAHQFFGFDSPELLLLLAPLPPVHEEAPHRPPSQPQAIQWQEAEAPAVEAASEGDVSPQGEEVVEAARDHAGELQEASVGASQSARTRLLGGLLRLRSGGPPVDSAPRVSWAVYEKLLQPPSSVPVHSVTRRKPRPRWQDGGSAGSGGAEASAQPSSWRGMRGRSVSPVESAAEKPAVEGRRAGAVRRAAPETVQESQDTGEAEEQRGQGQAEERGAEAAASLGQAAALTVVHALVRSPAAQKPTRLRAALIAAVAGPKQQLFALLCEDNVFRLLPEDAVKRAERDALRDTELRRRLEAALQEAHRSERGPRGATELLPAKQSWAAVPAGGFQAAGGEASLPVASALQALPQPTGGTL